jgi:hypothetical protein
MREKGVHMRERTVLEETDLLKLCVDARGRETTGSMTHDGIDPRWNQETQLLWRFCEVLFLRLGLGRPVGVHDSGGPTLAIDVERKILEVLCARIKGFSDPNDIIGTIRTHLLEPPVRLRTSGSMNESSFLARNSMFD